jgi:glycosyltransferase involved in cell wall biosynthesis
LVVSKGIYEIPEIDDLLKEKQIPVHWTIIGYGPESENFKIRMKNRTNFSYAAPSGNEELMKLLERQDVFVLPSRIDGLPVAMLEVMSKGIVPVMYKFNKGITKIITKDIGFVVEVGDNISLADCIRQLYHDRTLLRRMSEQARAKVVDEYDIKKQAEKYFHLYENIQPSTRKGKWKRLAAVHGKEFHPLMPGPILRIFRRLKNMFSKEEKDLSIDPLK